MNLFFGSKIFFKKFILFGCMNKIFRIIFGKFLFLIIESKSFKKKRFYDEL